MTPRVVRTLVIALTLALVAASCGSDSGDAGPDDAGPSAPAVAFADVERSTPAPSAAVPAADATAGFALDLYGELTTDPGNLIFSPHSIAVALAMTRAGAVGETAAAMDAVLHTTDLADLHDGFNALDLALTGRAGSQQRGDGTDATIQLNIANALWGQAGFAFLDPFLETLAADYGAGMRLVDYQTDAEGARSEINDWIADETEQRIIDLIPPGALNPATRLVLTNAVYLLAPWELTFDEASTSPGPFTRLDGADVQADLMRYREQLAYARVGSLQAVELPYAGRELAMLVIVPDDGAFADVEGSLDAALLAEITRALASREVDLTFPKFEFRTQIGLAQALRSLGMAIAFDGATADFSAMTTEADLFISDVIHEAFIAVDEEGTEAAAATAVIMEATAAPTDPVDLDVDRPFVFALRDVETGAILFLGRVMDPTA